MAIREMAVFTAVSVLCKHEMVSCGLNELMRTGGRLSWLSVRVV
ncbi:hypothetical protein [Propionivibrio dicarboxylicus]|nr:hypothetical protein [Propionivibrio dicarboxylicus]